MPPRPVVVIRKMDHLIRIKGTGSPRELADRLGISERSLYYYLALLRDLDAPVAYDRIRKSYYYEEIGYFDIGFKKLT